MEAEQEEVQYSVPDSLVRPRGESQEAPLSTPVFKEATTTKFLPLLTKLEKEDSVDKDSSKVEVEDSDTPSTASSNGSEDLSIDGGTGADPGVEHVMRLRKSISYLRSQSRRAGDDSIMDSETQPHLTCCQRDSQQFFADKGQTVIVFDWDDTLFPTWFLSEKLRMDMSLPFTKQKHLARRKLNLVKKLLATCEAKAVAALTTASEHAHVVVVTLASSGWVGIACQNFYPEVGRILQEKQIQIVYAQERARSLPPHNKLKYQSAEELERHWGLVKGQAIARELTRFYSQYEGQSWKNVISIGDSLFERYGLLAASSAYMQGTRITNPNSSVWKPDQEGCWEQVSDGHVKKLRAKCCKFVDEPDIDELTLELDVLEQWFPGMVALDDGFDLNLEALQSEEQALQIEAVLRCEAPVSTLPTLVSKGSRQLSK